MSVPDFAARPQLSEDVARYVRKRIFDGTYSAGEYVRLDQLAAELGMVEEDLLTDEAAAVWRAGVEGRLPEGGVGRENRSCCKESGKQAAVESSGQAAAPAGKLQVANSWRRRWSPALNWTATMTILSWEPDPRVASLRIDCRRIAAGFDRGLANGLGGAAA